jgi:hypothetical protein
MKMQVCNITFMLYSYIYTIFRVICLKCFHAQANATVKERDRDILQREALIRALHREREQALATLKKHGIPVNKNIHVSLPIIVDCYHVNIIL